MTKKMTKVERIKAEAFERLKKQLSMTEEEIDSQKRVAESKIKWTKTQLKNIDKIKDYCFCTIGMPAMFIFWGVDIEYYNDDDPEPYFYDTRDVSEEILKKWHDTIPNSIWWNRFVPFLGLVYCEDNLINELLCRRYRELICDYNLDDFIQADGRYKATDGNSIELQERIIELEGNYSLEEEEAAFERYYCS